MQRRVLIIGVITVTMCLTFQYYSMARTKSEIQQEIKRLEDRKDYFEGEIRFSEFESPLLVKEWEQEVKNVTKQINQLNRELQGSI